ncbi:MAG: hypothetical protein ABEJ65_05810 [bacterium]
MEKDGGRSDQLSSQPGLDRYRIRALEKFIKTSGSEPYRQRAAELIVEKCDIYAGGCRKRGKVEEARRYEKIRQWAKENYLPKETAVA